MKSQDEGMEPPPFVYVDTTEEGSNVPEEQGNNDGVEPDGEPIGHQPAPTNLPSSFKLHIHRISGGHEVIRWRRELTQHGGRIVCVHVLAVQCSLSVLHVELSL